MSLVSDVDKIADVAVNAMPIEVVAADELGIYKVVFVLGVIVLSGAIYFFYKAIISKINKVKLEIAKCKTDFYAKIDKSRVKISQEFDKVKENCDGKNERLTAVETKVSDMKSNLQLTVEDMIAHKTETDIRVSNLEKIVSDRLLPKLDDISDKVNQIVGRMEHD